jgi:FAD/FMN-containing dehydrogenase
MVLGYSYLSSQYGLALDNVAGFELVLPNGTVINVTTKDDDLWFGLRVSKKKAQ